jgi:hypothetical protein
MSSRKKLVSVAVALALGVVICLIVARKSEQALVPVSPTAVTSQDGTPEPDGGAKVVINDLPSVPGMARGANRIVRVKPGQILAFVNGHQLHLGDLVPMRTNNVDAEQALSRKTYEYLLQRAVDRELTFQTAKAEGVEFTQAQKLQLASFRNARQQSAPGESQRLNADGDQTAFELRDAAAFMLQAMLLANVGASPNVTPEQVLKYYQEHSGEFAELPQAEPARSETWAAIDYEIRQRQAASVRANFNDQVIAYMSRLKSQADIVVNQLPDAEASP